MAEALGEVYLRERGQVGVPSHILLDLDNTDDPTHGAWRELCGPSVLK